MSSQKGRKIVLYVSLGIEIRNFIHSGLLEKLRDLGDCYVYSCKHSKVLEQVCNENDLSIKYIPMGDIIRNTRIKGEDKFLSSRRARLRINGIKTFQLLGESPDIRIKDYLIGNRIIYRIYQEKNAKAVYAYYFSTELEKYYHNYNITDIVFQGYSSPEILTAAITASRLNINIWVINWGWKDFYINEYLNFKPKGLFVWSQADKELYCRFNTKLDDSNVYVIGNLSYDKMCVSVEERSIQPYLEKYNIPEDAHIFIYTLLNPTVFPNEETIVAQLLRMCNCHEKVFFLIKPNPMDPDWDRFYELERKYDNVRIMENMWVYDRENDFNMITTAGVKEWEDLLHFCTGTINVPSTVTIESLLCHKPVINPLYDGFNKVETEFLRLYNSSFYKRVHDRADVIATYTVNETLKTIKSIIDGEVRVQGSLESICLVGSALEIFGQVIEKAN
jgi:hypothetical protein